MPESELLLKVHSLHVFLSSAFSRLIWLEKKEEREETIWGRFFARLAWHLLLLFHLPTTYLLAASVVNKAVKANEIRVPNGAV